MSTAPSVLVGRYFFDGVDSRLRAAMILVKLVALRLLIDDNFADLKLHIGSLDLGLRS
jgi:hypothetical protein